MSTTPNGKTLAEVLELCGKMPPGPYIVQDDPRPGRSKGVGYRFEYEPREFCSVWLAREMNPEHAAFIAALDPGTVRAIIESHERMRVALVASLADATEMIPGKLYYGPGQELKPETKDMVRAALEAAPK